ncbi:MAG: DNA polymerase III subunit delta [Croceitalea sp.]|nr:DNA polymerase III subunit delta [Croceitalea sp.]NNL09339.1 DNA polymerase III subunit delta [Croceitalea sp.]NNM18387.1 DNA polymerase III subunit delta [Croceitalea sp.]
MEEVKNIINSIKNREFKPIYFLMGEEPYYIDRIAEYLADKVLDEAERGFNLMTIYGRDTSIDDIVSNAKRFPMMAEHQVVIVKEAQSLSRTIEQLVKYVENPQPTTILVICYKYKKLDKRKKLYKAVRANGVLFESKKLYDNQVADWIRRFTKGKGYSISPKSAALLVDYLGNDLSKINNEMEKLFLVIEKQTEITPAHIEKHIGISKDFNNFELKKAIGEKDALKASRIVNYFSQNPKENPFLVTISLLNNFFVQLLLYHGMADHSPRSVAQKLGINPYFVVEYQTAARNYSMKEISAIISNLRELDMKGKGVGSQNVPHSDLLKELLAAIF